MLSAGEGPMVSLVSFDGTKCCVQKLSDEGKVVESKCFPCKTIKIKAECVLEGYNERPGFVLTCNGDLHLEGDVLIIST